MHYCISFFSLHLAVKTVGRLEWDPRKVDLSYLKLVVQALFFPKKMPFDTDEDVAYAEDILNKHYRANEIYVSKFNCFLFFFGCS